MPRAERILLAMEFLKKLPEEHYTIDHTVFAGVGVSPDHVARQLFVIAQGERPDCGTSADLRGWFPAIFPKAFHWTPEGIIITDKRDFASPEYCAGYLGLHGMHGALFTPRPLFKTKAHLLQLLSEQCHAATLAKPHVRQSGRATIPVHLPPFQRSFGGTRLR